MTPTRPGHHGDTGGGQPPPPTVPSVKHSGAVAVPEPDAPLHATVQEVGIAEATALGRGGGKGSHLKGVQFLCTPPLDGDLLQIPGESYLGSG